MHLRQKREEANLASDLIFFRPCVKKTKTAELPEKKKEVISEDEIIYIQFSLLNKINK